MPKRRSLLALLLPAGLLLLAPTSALAAGGGGGTPSPISFDPDLAIDDLIQHTDGIAEDFHAFFPELIRYVRRRRPVGPFTKTGQKSSRSAGKTVTK